MKGTESSLASVCASSVLPVPVGPISRMFDFVQLDVVPAPRLLLNLDALVVVVDRDGELLLRPLLADDVLVEELLDLLRRRERGPHAARLEAVVVRDDVVADLDTLVADEDGRPGNQLADVVLILVAERAPQHFRFAVLLHHWEPLPQSEARTYAPGGEALFAARVQLTLVLRMTSSMIPYSLP